MNEYKAAFVDNDPENIKTENKGDSNNNTNISSVGVGGGPMASVAVTVTNVNEAPPMADAVLPPAPNSKPRERDPAPIETYVYRDFARAEPSTINTGTSHERMPPQSLQSQKLPSKLAAMLSDPGESCWGFVRAGWYVAGPLKYF